MGGKRKREKEKERKRRGEREKGRRRGNKVELSSFTTKVDYGDV